MNGTNKESSPEEKYFYNLNKELIDRKRKELDANKASAQNTHPHWMKCPKCGSSMEEVELTGIKVDKCVGCEGIYFDNGELQILIESKEPKGFLGTLKKLF